MTLSIVWLGKDERLFCLRIWDTVDCETPAAFAISVIVTFLEDILITRFYIIINDYSIYLFVNFVNTLFEMIFILEI